MNPLDEKMLSLYWLEEADARKISSKESSMLYEFAVTHF
jgi:hypothetical protein